MSLKHELIGNYLTNNFSFKVAHLAGRLNQRTFLNRTDQIKPGNLFVFFLRVAHVEEINELYGKWKTIKQKKAKSLFMILDASRFGFVGDDNDPSVKRYLEMAQDPDTKLVLLGKDEFDVSIFEEKIKQLIPNLN